MQPTPVDDSSLQAKSRKALLGRPRGGGDKTVALSTVLVGGAEPDDFGDVEMETLAVGVTLVEPAHPPPTGVPRPRTSAVRPKPRLTNPEVPEPLPSSSAAEVTLSPPWSTGPAECAPECRCGSCWMAHKSDCPCDMCDFS